jgi:fermentation-respiration switch protein FrsA (DUF1100 family)
MFRPVEANTAMRGLVIIFHGNAGNISHRLDYLRMFHDLGYASLIIDYRGYGRSSGKPSEEGSYRDADTAWQHATQALGYPAKHIVVFGESLGGAVAAQLASGSGPRRWCWPRPSPRCPTSAPKSIPGCRSACWPASATTRATAWLDIAFTGAGDSQPKRRHHSLQPTASSLFAAARHPSASLKSRAATTKASSLAAKSGSTG